MANIGAVAAILFMGFVAVAIGSELWIGIRRAWVGSQIEESYRQSAQKGEVARPAEHSDAIACWSVCYYSLPRSVTVKTTAGEKLFYFAERATTSDRKGTPWTFRFVTGEDASGNRITNRPSF